MKNILSKEQLLLLESLNENRVSWNKSALGLLSNAVLSPISWLSGSIKKGIKKQQIDNLIQQYGLEIVNAIKKIDMGEEKPLDKEKESTNSEESTEDDRSIIKNRQKYLNKFKDQLSSIKKIKPKVKALLSKDHLDLRKDEFNELLNVVNNVTDIIKIDDLLNFLEMYDIPGTEKHNDIINKYKKYIEIVKKSDGIKRFITQFQNEANTLDHLKKFYKNLSNVEDLYDLSVLELDEQLKENKNNKYIHGINRSNFNRYGNNTLNNTQINEVSAYTLPNNITSLLSKEQLEKVKSIPDIKEKMDEQLNKVRLNTIAYEANYIIEQSDKQQSELRKKWDLGIQNIKDYFQAVVDINTLPDGSGNVDSDIKSRIETDQKQLSELQKLNITETFPVGQEFKADKLYAIECVVTGQTNKNVRSILLISPVVSFKEDVNNDDYYLFKFFGQYEYDKSIDRLNIFNKLTNNQAMVNNFKADGSSYYLAFKNLKPSNKSNYVFIYSDTGKMFFNNETANVDKIKDKLQNYKGKDKPETLKKLEKLGNTVKIMINQRFVIEDEYVASYPGISKEDITNTNNSKNAMNNHQKLLKLL